MSSDVDDQLAAEVCLRDAWPAPETAGCQGWLLRAGQGGYNRINSVWTGHFTGNLAAAIEEAEAFYGARGLRPRFQMLDIAQPAGLDAELARRGYKQEPACSNMTKTVIGGAVLPDVSVTPDASRDWLDAYLGEQPAEKAAELPRILLKLPQRRGFIACRRDDRPAGVALVGRVGDAAAVDCVLTLPRFRRAGVARSIMQTAEAWAAGGGVQRLVLSVVDDNNAAITLYRSLGYRRLSGYHYRTAAAA